MIRLWPAARRRRRWPGLAIAAGLVGLLLALVAVTLLSQVWTQSDISRTDSEASVYGFVLAAGCAIVGMVIWSVRYYRASQRSADYEQIARAVGTLAGQVRAQWEDEARARSLFDPGPMPVRWRPMSPDRRSDLAAGDGANPVRFAGRSDDIGSLVEEFRTLPKRRLVIVGPKGSGKTTLAVQLLLELLPPASEPLASPVPVLFSASSWDPDEHVRLQDWLVAQLYLTYRVLDQISADAATDLVEQGHILPVVDGLDEITLSRRASLIERLNRDINESGVVLTCRREEYHEALKAANASLNGAVVVGPTGLTTAEAAAYLQNQVDWSDYRPSWETVLAALVDGTAQNLAKLATVPLWLWLVRVVYVNARQDPIALIDSTVFPTEAALKAHLLDKFVPATVKSRPVLPRRSPGAPQVPLRPSRSHNPHDLERWLTTIARQSGELDRPDWQWWELPRRELPGAGVRLALGSVLGLFLFGPPLVVGFSLLSQELFGLLLSGLLGIAVGWRMGRSGKPRWPAMTLRNRRDELLPGTLIGLGCGLLLGATVGLSGWLLFGRTFGLVGGIASGSAAALSGVLIALLGSGHPDRSATTPSQSYFNDRAVTLLAIVAFGTLGGLCGAAGGFVAGSVSDFEPGPIVGAGRGLVVGLAGGLVLGLVVVLLVNPWPLFLFVTAVSGIRGRLPAPWRLMPMLADCHQLGLLRTVGPVYQFRHLDLQKHLAESRPRGVSRGYVRNGVLVGAVVVLVGAWLLWPEPGIPVGESPGAVAVTQDGRVVYVSDDTDRTVSVIDTASGDVVRTIAVNGFPQGIAVTPDGRQVYVPYWIDGSLFDAVAVIDADSGATVDTIAVGISPYNVAVSPDGEYAYVTNSLGDSVSVIDTTARRVVATIDSNGPWDVAVAPEGRRAYVSNFSDDLISVINTDSNTVVSTFNVGNGPKAIAVSPDGRQVYVANSFSNSVSVVNTDTGTVINVATVNEDLSGVAVSPDGRQVYVTSSDSDSVIRIDPQRGTLIDTIGVGKYPVDVAIAADGRAYVANAASDTVSVIEAEAG